MTAEQFKEKFSYSSYKSLMDKYKLAYFLVSDVIHINKLETLVEKYGFTVERQDKDYLTSHVLWSKVLFEDKIVGHIDLQGFPSIEFHKRKRKLAAIVVKDDMVIAPIEGIHRILDWHTVKGKMHCLVGGETVLHVLPDEMTEEVMTEWIEKLGVQALVQ